MDHNYFMNRALELAVSSAEKGTGPFGCVIVKENKIISEGFNQVTSSKDPTAHAEIVAIRNATKTENNFFLEDCILYTSSYPCPMCLGAIKWAHVSKVYYANDIKVASDAGFDDSDILDHICSGKDKDTFLENIKIEDSNSAFNTWKNNLNKIEY